MFLNDEIFYIDRISSNINSDSIKYNRKIERGNMVMDEECYSINISPYYNFSLTEIYFWNLRDFLKNKTQKSFLFITNSGNKYVIYREDVK